MNQEDLIKLLGEIRQVVGLNLELSHDVSDEYIRELITKVVLEKSKTQYLSLTEKNFIIKSIFNSIRRMDILQPLLEDETITEIMINSYEEIYVEQAGFIRRLELKFESVERLENIIQAIVGKVNRVVNEASPIVDARLADGSRVNVVLPPISLKGPAMTIRKFPEQPMTVEKLIYLGSITKAAANFLEALVKAKYNIFISGGTGSGKTTFLNALSDFIPSHERIITIEDSAELQLHQIENLVRLETRMSNTEDKGAVNIRDLIKTSLRMRPDRIIVGEVRGPEALDMLQAMNTGHDGSLSTGHANTPKDMLSRLETMVLSAASLPIQVIRKQIAAAIDLIIHLGRLRDGSRKVLEISELVECIDGEIVLNPLFSFVEEKEVQGQIIGSLYRTDVPLTNTFKLKMAGIHLDEEGGVK